MPILKTGKPSSRLDSYRPISLTSFAAEVAERIVHDRLTWFLEQKRCLPLDMTGFRSHLSVPDCILDFTSDMEFQVNRCNSSLAVFLDVEKAYDRARVDAVLHHLAASGVCGRVPVTLQIASRAVISLSSWETSSAPHASWATGFIGEAF